MDRNKGRRQVTHSDTTGRGAPKRITEADSDEEASNMQTVMNCIYLLIFFVIVAIFVLQFWLAHNRPYDERRDAEDL